MGRPAGDSPSSKSSIDAPEWDAPEVTEQRERLQQRIATLRAQAPAASTGRGIVMPVGKRYFASAWVSLSLLRGLHNCQLPVEIWYLGEDDLPSALRALLQPFQVELVDAHQSGQQVPRSGWELKPHAAVHSRFAQLLLLDADNVPLCDPTPLFDEPAVLRDGALFWPDLRQVNPYNPIWGICGIAPPAEFEWESGQFVIDKARCWPALQLTLHLNTWSDFFYRFVHGDKETFHLAWRLLGAQHALAPPAERALGRYEGEAKERFVGLWQHDPSGRRVFLHRTDAKWAAWGRNFLCNGFELQDACEAALAELRLRWDGLTGLRPEFTREKRDQDGGANPRSYCYVRSGIEARRLDLLPSGRIGEGVRQYERFWRIEETEGETELILSGRDGDTCRLIGARDGTWRGSWEIHEQVPVEMIPIADEPSGRLMSDERPRLLYISPVMPADTGNGLAMRAASVLRLLTDRYRVSLLIVPHYPQGLSTGLPDWISERCEEVRVAYPPHSGQAGDDPDDEQRRLEAWVESAWRAFHDRQFAVIHSFRTVTLHVGKRYGDAPNNQSAELHLDLDDVESRTQARLAWLYGRRGLTERRREAEGLASRAEALELGLLRSWDRLYVCSETDREELSALLPERYAERHAELRVLPNLVKMPANPHPIERGPIPTMLYVGTLSYFPNSDAVEWFCRGILPLIRELEPGRVRLLLAGTGAPQSVQELGHIPEVEYLGPVADLADCYRQANLVVVPLRAGGGTRIKILEALAHRRPVVSTARGAEGLEVVDGQHVLIADRAVPFARHCVRLLNDLDLAARMGDRGRLLVEQRYNLDRPHHAPTG